MTTPARTFNQLDRGDLAPDFTLPRYPNGCFKLSEDGSDCGVLLYFSESMYPPHSMSPNVIALASRLADFNKASVQVVVVSRHDYPLVANALLAQCDSQLSLLLDREVHVGKLYGCHCLEDCFAVSWGYDHCPQLVLIDRSRIVRLYAEVTTISSAESPRQLIASDMEQQLWSCEAGFTPQALSIEFLLQLATHGQ